MKSPITVEAPEKITQRIEDGLLKVQNNNKNQSPYTKKSKHELATYRITEINTSHYKSCPFVSVEKDCYFYQEILR
jgi:hypothetical protein